MPLSISPKEINGCPIECNKDALATASSATTGFDSSVSSARFKTSIAVVSLFISTFVASVDENAAMYESTIFCFLLAANSA